MKLGLVSLLSVAAAWSPTDSYAPGTIDCPSGDVSLVRSAENISSDEESWLQGRDKVTQENLISFLEASNLTDFDASSFVNGASDPIRIGVAFLGGGYRAMLSGAGQLAALDNRTAGASTHGLGGLLQASTYLVGLSGGNWLVGTIAMNNFTYPDKILSENKIWDLTHSIVNYGGINVVKTVKYYTGISDDLQAKEDAGFRLSLTDTWGRALLHQFFTELNDTGASLTWSTLQESDVFTLHQMPFPIVVADGRTPGETIVAGNSTIFEVNPYELGSWDESLFQFTQVKYLGTNMTDGKPNGKCIGGFDNAGFIMGTSSTLFNQFILQINTTSLASAVKSIVTSLLSKASRAEQDVALYEPNPFYKTDDGDVSSIAENNTLYLVDGGEDYQNVPFYPLIQPQRKVDVIFAYDNSADTNQSWPNGASLVLTFERQLLEIGNGTVFPHVPDINSFRNLNLTSRPAFFGCDARNLSSLFEKDPHASKSLAAIFDVPLVVYTANRPFTYWSNTSTFKLSYSEKEKRGMIKNGFEVASRYNLTLDSDWPACVSCAIIRREQERRNQSQSDQCKQCFSKYCWDGSLDTASPGINFTETGSTNGNEDTHTSAGSGLLSLLRQNVMPLVGYGLVVSMAFLVNF